MKVIDKLEVCAGQPNLKFVEFIQSQKGCVLTDKKGQTVDDYASVTFNGVLYHQTIRSSKCEIDMENVMLKRTQANIVLLT